MKTVDIKGKEYVEVNERIKHFRSNPSYEGYKLTSEIVSIKDGVCIIKASVYNKEGELVATGHAYEKENSSFINKTSYIENCETSAWGRALGNLGIGIDTSIASLEEVQNATKQQQASVKKEAPKTPEIPKPKLVKKFFLENGFLSEEERKGVKEGFQGKEELPEKAAKELIFRIDKRIELDVFLNDLVEAKKINREESVTILSKAFRLRGKGLESYVKREKESFL